MMLTLWIALVAALLGALIFYWITKLILRFKLKKRFNRAAHGESEAQDLLTSAGYVVEETQMTSKLSMWVNGEAFSYLVRPDAFASKDNQLFLVEVKTGKVATNPKNTSTRRQLLEYFYGFDVEGILLVDADQKQIHKIHFEINQVKIDSSSLQDKIKKKLKDVQATPLLIIAFSLFYQVNL